MFRMSAEYLDKGYPVIAFIAPKIPLLDQLGMVDGPAFSHALKENSGKLLRRWVATAHV